MAASRRARAVAAGLAVAFVAAALGACGSSPRPAAARRAAPAATGATAAPTAGPTATPAPAPAPEVPLERAVGQLVMAGMAGAQPDADLLERVRDGQVGGIILFGANVSTGLAAAMASLQRAAGAGGNPPLLISVDQEGGPIRRLPGPPDSPRAMAGPDEARRQGEATGALLAGDHLNVDLAPIADVSRPGSGFEAAQDRGFAGEPEQVASLAAAFAYGLRQHGVAATAKHFPGIGSLAEDTDARVGRVDLARDRLEQELLPFRRLIGEGVELVMVANAVFPALDGRAPAMFSPAVVQDLLRRELGYGGVVITDDLDSTPGPGGDAGLRAVAAVAAGADMALYRLPPDGPVAARALLAAVRDGSLPEARVREAYGRVVALKRRLGS